MSDDARWQLALAQVQGYLAAFEALNGGADHVPTYALDPVPVAGEEDLTAALERHVARDTNYALTLVPVREWEPALRGALPGWLFSRAGHARGLGAYLAAHDARPALESACVNRLLDLLRALLGASGVRAWELRIAPRDGSRLEPWYEASWADYVLWRDGHTHAFLLHLGISD